jgi:hypothetical protein
MEKIDHSIEESGNPLAPVPTPTSSTAITNILSTSSPTFTFPYPSGEGPSSLPRPLPQHLQVSRHLAPNRRSSRRLRSIEFEPPTVTHRMMRAEQRISRLKDRTNILRTKVENQDSLIVSLESEMEETQLKIDSLEHTVLNLQERIHRFEMMFEAISKATTITPSSPSQ